MAVTILDAWAEGLDSDPTGSPTISAGSNRCFVLALLVEGGWSSLTVLTMTVGGQTYDEAYEYFVEDGTKDRIIYVYLWKEATIAAMSGTSISYTDNQVMAKRAFYTATYQDVNQTTFPKGQDQVNSSTNVTSLDLTTTSADGDRILAFAVTNAAGRSFVSWDTLTEQYDSDPDSNCSVGVAEGNGGDSTTTVTINLGDTMAAMAIVLTPASGATATISSVGDFDIVYDNELRVTVTGTEFEASQGTGTVKLHSSDPQAGTPATSVTQTVRTWSDTAIVIDIDKGALADDLVWLEVAPETNGAESLQIVVRDDPGANAIGLRTAIPTQEFTEGVAFNLDAGAYFHATDVQDTLTFSIAGQPTGLSISDDGLISGTVSDGASGSSPFTTTVTLTDSDGNSVNDEFSWTITGPTPNPGTESPASVRKRRPPMRASAGKMFRR